MGPAESPILFLSTLGFLIVRRCSVIYIKAPMSYSSFELGALGGLGVRALRFVGFRL